MLLAEFKKKKKGKVKQLVSGRELLGFLPQNFPEAAERTHFPCVTPARWVRARSPALERVGSSSIGTEAAALVAATVGGEEARWQGRLSGESPRNLQEHFPYGLAVRIPGFHPGGPGSTPGMGM